MAVVIVADKNILWQEWAINDFTEGLIDRVEDDLLPFNATSDCQNFIARKVGSLQKRRGQTRWNSLALAGPVHGLHAYYTATNNYLVAVGGSTAYYWDTAESVFRELKTGLDQYAPVDFETCVNYMVAFNGINAPWKWNGTVVSNLNNAPSDGKFAVLFKEKLFTVPASEPSTLRWSDSFQPEQWPSVNYWDVRKGDGDSITCLKVHYDELVIFKRRSINVLRGTNLDDFRLDTYDTSNGCVGPFASVTVGPFLYFISDDGLCVWNGVRAVNLSKEKIPNLWNRVNKEYIHKAAMGYWDGLVWAALPLDSAQYNNAVLIYYTSGGGATDDSFWLWTGINASCFLRYNTRQQICFVSGDAVSGYVNRQDYGTNDFGNPINAYWVGKAFDVAQAERKCRFGWAVIQDVPSAADVDIQFSIDYGSYFSLEPGEYDNLVRRYNFYQNYTGRYLKPKIVHNSLGGCDVRGIKVFFMPFTRGL